MVGDEIRLRADARHNHDRLLEVAAVAFARDGAGASLKSIAQDAGVGIGTLYRRFPAREDLVEATYRAETARLCDSAGALLAERGPRDGLRDWAGRFLEYLVLKHGMADALPAILAAREGLRASTRTRIHGAIAVFLTAGADEGLLRRDVASEDVMMGLGGTALIAAGQDDPALGARLVDLLVDGLRPETPPA